MQGMLNLTKEKHGNKCIYKESKLSQQALQIEL